MITLGVVGDSKKLEQDKNRYKLQVLSLEKDVHKLLEENATFQERFNEQSQEVAGLKLKLTEAPTMPLLDSAQS